MKFSFVLYLLINLIFLNQCSSKDVKKVKKKPEPCKAIKVMEIKGKIEVYPQEDEKEEVYIVARWQSRSRISYLIKNPETVRGKKDKILVIKARLCSQMSPFKGEVEIIKILKELE